MAFLCRMVASAVVIMYFAGCASVNPDSDYKQTSTLITDRTGSPDTFTPAVNQDTIDKNVKGLLAGGVTVVKAVRIALWNNPRLQALFYNVGVSRADLVQAGLPSNPSFSLSNRWPVGGGYSNLTGSFSQAITDLLLIPLKRDIAEKRLEQAKYEVAQKAVAMVAEVKRDCYRLMALQKAGTVSRENLDLATKSFQLAKDRFNAGQCDKLDVDLAQSDLFDVKRELMMLQRDRLVARADLGAILGLARGDLKWKLTDDFPGPMAFSQDADPFKTAVKQRFDLRFAQFKIKSAEKELSREKWGILPHIEIGGEYERAESPPDLRGLTFDFTLPLWDQNQAQIARASLSLERLKKEYENLLDSVAAEVERTGAALHANEKLVQFFANEVLPHAEQSVETATRAYKSGRHDVLRLIQSQRSLISERRNYVAALKDYATSLSDLEFAVGGNLAEIKPIKKSRGKQGE